MTLKTWTPESVSDLVGVVDLLDGNAVHAVAGHRSDYRPVAFCDGSPLRLVEHYLSLGVSAIYVADLTAIQTQIPQTEILHSIAATGATTWFDLGWTKVESANTVTTIESLSKQFSSAQFIAATESCSSLHSLEQLVERVGAERTWLGLDYRSGRLLGCEPDEKRWVAAAQAHPIAGFIALDLAAVGTARGPATEAICQRIHTQAPEMPIISGGGIRSPDDAYRLRNAGCNQVLVATALLGRVGSEE